MNKPNNIMMNFWTPTFTPWNEGLNPTTMPFYVYYDYVETYSYNSSTKGFDLLWREDFNGSTID